MKNKSLSKAISLAIVGSTVAFAGVSTASAKAVYNTYNAYDQAFVDKLASFGRISDRGGLGTDGWVWGKNVTSNFSIASGHAEASPWVGTADGMAPLGYKGSAPLNWAVTLDAAGEHQEISRQDAYDTYGVYADIDTAGGAWVDQSGQGWAHNTDLGLLKSSVDQLITLTANAPTHQFANFGITVFEGMDTNQEVYSHHVTWNNEVDGPDEDNPWESTQGLINLDYSDTVDEVNGFTFQAEAGKIYTIALGGSGGTHWNGEHGGYALSINAPAAVPIPGAVWLMATGLISLFSLGRKKKLA